MQLQSVKPLLAFACEFIVELRSGWWDAHSVLHLVRLFTELVPLGFSGFFSFVRTVLQLVVIVRAVVEELRVDLHKELHSVVHHAVNGPEPWLAVVQMARCRIYLFQWPFEFSYKGANMMGKIVSTLSLTRLQKYSLFQK